MRVPPPRGPAGTAPPASQGEGPGEERHFWGPPSPIFPVPSSLVVSPGWCQAGCGCLRQVSTPPLTLINGDQKKKIITGRGDAFFARPAGNPSCPLQRDGVSTASRAPGMLQGRCHLRGHELARYKCLASIPWGAAAFGAPQQAGTAGQGTQPGARCSPKPSQGLGKGDGEGGGEGERGEEPAKHHSGLRFIAMATSWKPYRIGAAEHQIREAAAGRTPAPHARSRAPQVLGDRVSGEPGGPFPP